MKFTIAIFLVVVLAYLIWNRAAARSVQIAAPDAKILVDQGALLVDVRTPAEYAAGHLPGALNIPYDQIAARTGELGVDQGRAIVLYCRSGNRSGLAHATLEKLGFKKTFNAGGFSKLNQVWTSK